MDQRITCAILAFASATLFFLAVGLDGWNCPGGIFSDLCQRSKVNQVTAPLILVAGLVTLACGIFIVLVLAAKYSWSLVMGAVTAIIAAILGGTGVFYYIVAQHSWSPFIATIAMTATFALTIVVIMELINK